VDPGGAEGPAADGGVVLALHPDATAFSAFRILPSGSGRQYSIAIPAGLAWTLRVAEKVGHVEPTDPNAYAVLDVLDGKGDIVQDFSIPTPAAWQWWKRKLGLRLAEDRDHGFGAD
jgi:hypothetical protein